MLGILIFAAGMLIGAAIVFAGWRKVTPQPVLADELYNGLSSASEEIALHISTLRDLSKEIEDEEIREDVLGMLGRMMEVSDDLRYQRYLLLKQIYKDL